MFGVFKQKITSLTSVEALSHDSYPSLHFMPSTPNLAVLHCNILNCFHLTLAEAHWTKRLPKCLMNVICFCALYPNT